MGVCRVAIVACGSILGLACTHMERTRYAEGQKLEHLEASTFLGVKTVAVNAEGPTTTAELQGEGVSDNFRDIAIQAIETSPELAAAIVRAMRPGGALEGVVEEITERVRERLEEDAP